MTTNENTTVPPQPVPPRGRPQPLRDRLRHLGVFMRTFHLDRAVLAWIRANRLLAAAIALIPLIGLGLDSQLPYLNGPPEWRWIYTVYNGFWATWLWVLCWMLPGLALIAKAVALVLARLRRPALRRAAAFTGLILFGLYAHWLSFSACSPVGFNRVAHIILDGATTSYYTVSQDIAARKLPPLGEALRRYPELLHTFPLHASTHPPGPVLVASGLRAFFAACPPVRAGALACFKLIGLNPQLFSPIVSDLDQVAATTLGLLLALGGLLGAVPLYGLIRETLGPDPRADATAWSAAALWITWPALIAFEPEFDQLYAAFTLATFYCAVRGLRHHPAAWGAAAGLAFMLAISFSFTLLLLAPMLCLLAALELTRRAGRWQPAAILAQAHPARPAGRRLWFLVGAAVATCLAFHLILSLGWGIRLDRIFFAALRHQHEVLLPEINRSYKLWLFFNIYDFLFFAGPVAVVLGLAALGRTMREGWRSPATLAPAWIVFPLTVLALDVSGLTPAETSRIWLFLAPGLAWGAAAELVRRSGERWRLNLAVVLLAQSAFYYLCQCKLELLY